MGRVHWVVTRHHWQCIVHRKRPCVAEGARSRPRDSTDGTSEFSGCRTALEKGCIDWPLFQGGNGHVYEYVRTPGTWTSANATARVRSFRGVAGHLASIHSSAENTLVNSLKGTGDMRGWIGLHDSVTEGAFQWVTGEPFTFTNWTAGEPNNGLNVPGTRPRARTSWRCSLRASGTTFLMDQWAIKGTDWHTNRPDNAGGFTARAGIERTGRPGDARVLSPELSRPPDLESHAVAVGR